MNRILKKYLFSIMLISLCVIMVVDYFLVSSSLVHDRTYLFGEKLNQLVAVLQGNAVELDTLVDSLNEDYLTRAQAFAYLIEKDATILEDQDELQRIAGLLNVDELHVSDEIGRIAYSTVPKYVGLDFHDGEQMRGFLPVLDGEAEYVVQDVQPNTAEGKMMQYVGVRRPDQKGIVQVGLEPRRLLEAMSRNQYSYILARIPTDTAECIFALDVNSGEVVGATSSSSVSEERLKGSHLTAEALAACEGGGFLKIAGMRIYAVTRPYEDLLLTICVSEDELYASRSRELLSMFAFSLLFALAITITVDRLLHRVVLSRLQSIVEDITTIRNGDLNKTVESSRIPEFKVLAENINDMVHGIINTMTQLSRVIDVTGIPMANFEYQAGAPGVMHTSRLAELLDLTKDELRLLDDCKLFQQKLVQIMSHPVPDEPNVYDLPGDRYVKLAIVRDGDTTMGSVMDVSEEYRRRCHLNYERRHDGLTGLRNYRAFQEDVNRILRSGFAAQCASVMIDLDNLKTVNDTFGHDWGDEYLKAFAQVLCELPEGHCCYARRSGDEFCLFLHGYVRRSEILAVVNHLWRRIERASLDMPDGQTIPFRASGGLTWASGLDFSTAMREADNRLYAAKQTRKGACVIPEDKVSEQA